MKNNKIKDQFDHFPTTQGIIKVKDIYNQHLWTMYTDNIQARARHVASMDEDLSEANKKGASWGEGRIQASNIGGEKVFEYTEMPGATVEQVKQVATMLDSQSISKNLPEQANFDSSDQQYKFTGKQMKSTNYFDGGIKNYMNSRYNTFTKQQYKDGMDHFLRTVNPSVTPETVSAKTSTSFSWWLKKGVISEITS